MIPTRKTDEKFYRLFSTFHAFSEHLTKREDNELRDKYDHNAFCYSGQPTEDELRAALAYQKARGDAFLKLEGYEPLANAFGMECEETVTMVLPKGTDISDWKANPEVSIKTPDFDRAVVRGRFHRAEQPASPGKTDLPWSVSGRETGGRLLYFRIRWIRLHGQSFGG